MGDPWSEVPQGTITDEDIVKLAESGKLVVEAFERDSVREACYELRASNIVWDLTSKRENKRVILKESESYILRPHSYATVIAKEKIELPSNVLGRILAKGQLFSIGVLPVSTYADPGFRGRLGITLYNASHRYIVVTPGQAIAKIEFCILPKPVVRPYSGQHGYETNIWPVPVHLYADDATLSREGIDPDSIEEVSRIYGASIAELARRFRYYQRRVWVHIGITVAAFAIILAVADRVPLVLSLLSGVAANLVTSFALSVSARRSTSRRYEG